MGDNVGSKIIAFAKIALIVTLVLFVGGGIALIAVASSNNVDVLIVPGVIMIPGGIFCAIANYLLLTGFGEMVVNSGRIADSNSTAAINTGRIAANTEKGITEKPKTLNTENKPDNSRYDNSKSPVQTPKQPVKEIEKSAPQIEEAKPAPKKIPTIKEAAETALKYQTYSGSVGYLKRVLPDLPEGDRKKLEAIVDLPADDLKTALKKLAE